jgi:hypothetical protein
MFYLDDTINEEFNGGRRRARARRANPSGGPQVSRDGLAEATGGKVDKGLEVGPQKTLTR